MKALVLGIMIAIAAAVVAVRVLRQAPPAVDVPNIDAAAAERRSDSGAMPVQPSPEVRHAGAPTREPDQVAASPAASNATEPGPEHWDGPCECWAAWYARKQERENAARAAESKDINWAYEMEQLLGQFIAAHPKARTIQISDIDCRTSFCEIKAIGHPKSRTAFHAVIDQARNEPWSTFGNRHLGSTSRDDGQREFHAIIRRTPASTTTISAENRLLPSVPSIDEEECECATSEWQTRRAVLKIVARAAESKDIYWAYAMEQRLQQLLTAHPQAVTFQVSSIGCRTTFCEIKAIGLTDRSTDVFEEIFSEAIPHEEFGLTREIVLSSRNSDGRIELNATVTRKR